MLKVCTTCQVEKEVDEFRKDGSRKDGRSTRCKGCLRAKDKAWREANPEARRASGKTYYEANFEAMKSSQKAWREANLGYINAKRRAWREANLEAHRAKDKVRRDANPEVHRARDKAWREANQEYVKAKYAAYTGGLDRDPSDKYVKQLLGLKEATPELIEAKREQLMLHRATHELNKLLKEIQK